MNAFSGSFLRNIQGGSNVLEAYQNSVKNQVIGVWMSNLVEKASHDQSFAKVNKEHQSKTFS